MARLRTFPLLIVAAALSPAAAAAGPSYVSPDSGVNTAPVAADAPADPERTEPANIENPRHLYDTRQALREAVKSAPDISLLFRLARLEEISGTSAGRVYADLASHMERISPRPSSYKQVLEHGLNAALRESDDERVRFFTSRLGTAVPPQPATLRELSAGIAHPIVTIPGGMEALGSLFHFQAGRADRFLVDYCRGLRNAVADSPQNAAVLSTKIHRYFELVRRLEALGSRQGKRVVITVSTADQESRLRTARAVDLLGLKLHFGKQEPALTVGEKAAQAARQELCSALAIDTVAMEEALRAGRPFRVELVDDDVPVLLGEAAWRDAFGDRQVAGGLAEVLARDVRIAKVYSGLAPLDREVLTGLLACVPLKSLIARYSQVLCRYGSALGVTAQSANIPGDRDAAKAWEKLAGASPEQPGSFFRALLEKDEGKLLAFFSTLMGLDIEHQRFCTRTSERLSALYEVFRETRELPDEGCRRLRPAPLSEFLREVPLDREGNIRFPGSPDIWMPGGEQERAHVKALAPHEEDKIVVELARTHHAGVGSEQIPELESFLAVVRIEAGRREPLDEESALLLAREYPENYNVYPYFASLTGLGREDFKLFFALLPKWRALPGNLLHAVLGEFHALTKLLSLAEDSGALTPGQAAGLFRRMCAGFRTASSNAEHTALVLDLTHEMLALGVKGPATDPDRAIQQTLLSPTAPVSFTLNGASYQVDAAEIRSTRFRKVLAAQRVPPLGALLAMRDAGSALAAHRGSESESIERLEAAGRQVPNERVKRVVARFRRAISEGRAVARDLGELQRELLTALRPEVRIALGGLVYAYFLSPDDLLVSEDPGFLRKHLYAGDSAEGSLFPNSALRSGAAGSYLSGGFADFSWVAGKVAAIGSGVENSTQPMFAAQIGALRAVSWSRLRQHDLRLLGLRIRVAREWIVRSSSQSRLLSDLAAATQGLLSARRRADLLGGIESGDWKTVWRSVTESDLYYLSGRYLRRYSSDPWESAVTAELRNALSVGDASSPNRLFGCNRSHLPPPAPYEEYEHHFLPDGVSRRAAEFALYLANQADLAGVPVAVLGAIAEPAIRSQWSEMHIADPWDWRNVLTAYAAFTQQSFSSLLATP